ncbi:MAG: hypothetical protein LUF25_06205, partial [Phascolarctobacterium sp.]|nr:hypothetical protein [Phascolarctobacterium sp.]
HLFRLWLSWLRFINLFLLLLLYETQMKIPTNRIVDISDLDIKKKKIILHLGGGTGYAYGEN